MPYSPVLFCIRASKSFPVWCQSGRTKSLLVIGVFPSKTIPLVQYGCHIHPPIHRAHTGCKPPPWEYLRVKVWLRRFVKKNGYFTVRLAVRFDPLPPFTVSFLWFFFVFYWPYIMIICVLKRILHTKKQFPCNYWNPQFLLFLLLISYWVDISEIAQPTLIIDGYFWNSPSLS